MHSQVPLLIQALAPVIHKYGYVAVFGLLMLEDLGMPVPGETVLIAAAFYAGLHQLNIALVIIAAILGAIIGDNIGFAIGEYGGHPLVLRFGTYVFITPKRLHAMEHFFSRYGAKVVVVARFVEGLRQLNGLLAGLSQMRWPTFLIYNGIGATLWVGTWAAVGYIGGAHIGVFLRLQGYLTAAALAAVVGYALQRAAKRRARQNQAKINNRL